MTERLKQKVRSCGATKVLRDRRHANASVLLLIIVSPSIDPSLPLSPLFFVGVSGQEQDGQHAPERQRSRGGRDEGREELHGGQERAGH